ncbi:hypothetical protein HPB51_011603 [Rhipicephalus microplus]|uniref:Uncharacterized protein n=1 Tax=Rhipicephalus microplus TaxID=6941 RepID=A0A9J6E878_RHIMP|nr:hypothetical protein HPB51_011603 [Rhipicephalus microplus]
MDDKRKLVELGKEMGLSGEALLAWVSAEEKEMRDQRAKDREEARLAAQVEHEREIARMEAERLLLEERRRVTEAQRPSTSSADDSMGGVVLGNIAGVLSAARPAPKQPARRPKLAQIHHDPVCTEEEPEDATSSDRRRQDDMSAAAGKERKKPSELIVPRIQPLVFHMTGSNA